MDEKNLKRKRKIKVRVVKPDASFNPSVDKNNKENKKSALLTESIKNEVKKENLPTIDKVKKESSLKNRFLQWLPITLGAVTLIGITFSFQMCPKNSDNIDATISGDNNNPNFVNGDGNSITNENNNKNIKIGDTVGAFIANNTFVGNVENFFQTENKDLSPIKLKVFPSDDFNRFIDERNNKAREELQVTEISKLPGVFGNGCLLYYEFTNTSDNEIVIDRFSLDAWNIKINKAPVIFFTEDYCDEPNSISIKCYNEGWGTANKIDFKLRADHYFIQSEGGSDVNNLSDFSEYGDPIYTNEETDIFLKFFPYFKLESTINQLDAGDTINDIFTLNLKDKKINIDQNYEIAPKINFICDGQLGHSYIRSIFLNNEILVFDGRGGGGGKSKYGMLIPTNNYTYSFSKEVTQVIPAHETARIPVFFFPDKSASMNFKVTFDTTCETQPVVSYESSLEFFVSSILGLGDSVDIENIPNFMEVSDPKNDIVTFPYSLITEFEMSDETAKNFV